MMAYEMIEVKKAKLGSVALWLVLVLLVTGLYWGKWDAPPFGFHQWREADTADFILNYAQDSDGFWLPKVHQRGQTTGINAGEFPLVYFGMAQLINPAQRYYWVMRAFSLLHFALAVIAFTKICGLLFNIRDSLSGIFLAANPLMLYYGFKVMPEIYVVSYGLLGIWTGLRSKLNIRTLSFWLSGLFFSLSLAMKPFCISFILVPIWVAWSHRTREKGEAVFWPGALLLGCIPILAMLGWRMYSMSLNQEYGLHYFDLQLDWEREIAAWVSWRFYEVLLLQYGAELYLSYGGCLILLVALTQWAKRKVSFDEQGWQHMRLIMVLFALTLPVVLVRSHHITYYHDYYGIYLVPVLSAALYLLWHNLRLSLGQRQLLVLFLILGAVGRIDGRFRAPTNDYLQVRDQLADVSSLQDRYLVFDQTPVVKLNLANRYGKSIDPSTPVEEVYQEMTGGYSLLCVVDLTPCENVLAQKPAVMSAVKKRLVMVVGVDRPAAM